MKKLTEYQKIYSRKGTTFNTVNEAFKAGDSLKVVTKMLSILERKTGEKFTISPYPTGYTNKFGKFLGYYASYASGKKLVRVNFHLTKSDTIVSFDYYSPIESEPTNIISLQGFNIVQVIDQIADVITGEYFRYTDEIKKESILVRKAQSLSEARVAHSTVMPIWIEANFDRLTSLVSSRSVDYVSLNDEYSTFSNTTYGLRPLASVGSFKSYLSHSLNKQRGGEDAAANIPTIQVQNGSSENLVTVDPAGEDAYNALVENEHLLKFNLMKAYMEAVKDLNPEFVAVFIYGMGGVGKSHWAKQILVPLPNCVYRKGGVSGYTGLLQVLFDNRYSNQILIMDDFLKDSDFKGQIENILKAALDPEPPRQIFIIKKITGTETESVDSTSNERLIVEKTKSGVRFKLTEEDEYDLVDFDDVEAGVDQGDESLFDFEFKGSLVVISNMTKIPQALDDRCWKVEMNFSNDQLLDMISRTFINIAGENSEDAEVIFNFVTRDKSTTEDKSTVHSFMTAEMGGRKTTKRIPTFRLYSRALSLYLALKGNSDWEKYIRMELHS